MSYPLDAITHTYLGSNVYAQLRNALITGGLKPDDRLRIRELAAQLGTSVTPVRDAILQLAKEKALVLKDAQGHSSTRAGQRRLPGNPHPAS